MTQRDARDLRDGETLRGDVCIVGAGAAGIALALELMDNGLEVILLEGGGFERDADVQSLYAGDVIGDYFPLDGTRLRYFGGSTNHWEGYCHPLDTRDLTVRPSIDLPGWPLAWDDLADHYPRANELCQLGPFNYDSGTWAAQVDRPLLDLNPERLANGVIRRSPPTRFGTEYRDHLVEASDIHVYLHANVVEILTASAQDASRVEGVRIGHFDGSAQTVEAPLVVVATGGMENVRLLLSSRDDRGRTLGNSSGLVGRTFMEHPHTTAGYLLADEGVDLSFYTEDIPVDETFARGLFTVPAEVRAAHGIGNLVALLFPTSRSAADSDDLEGGSGVRDLRRSLGAGESEVHRVLLIGEQLPHVDSRIALSQHHRDELGMPRLELRWRLDERDLHTLRTGAELVASSLASVGVGRLRSLLHVPRPQPRVDGGHHHMGTTRMSDDPARGVVDANSRVHGVEGLYIAGSSVFPTGGWANPTLSLLALSVRLADHLREV